MEFRIGERDAATGLYQVIWADGSQTLNGMKIFNAEHRVGDVVEATQRSDGMMILDGPKAVDVSMGFGVVPGSKADGYLRGQVWNDEDVKKIIPSKILLLAYSVRLDSFYNPNPFLSIYAGDVSDANFVFTLSSPKAALTGLEPRVFGGTVLSENIGNFTTKYQDNSRPRQNPDRIISLSSLNFSGSQNRLRVAFQLCLDQNIYYDFGSGLEPLPDVFTIPFVQTYYSAVPLFYYDFYQPLDPGTAYLDTLVLGSIKSTRAEDLVSLQAISNSVGSANFKVSDRPLYDLGSGSPNLGASGPSRGPMNFLQYEDFENPDFYGSNPRWARVGISHFAVVDRVANTVRIV